MNDISNYQISITRDEALVLFDLLQRFSEEDVLEIKHQSEKRVLWNLCCELEKVMVEPFMIDYIKQLNTAKENLSH
jgi:hypothetical protein